MSVGLGSRQLTVDRTGQCYTPLCRGVGSISDQHINFDHCLGKKPAELAEPASAPSQ